MGGGLVAPYPLSPATAAVLLTLVDGDTQLWIDPGAAAARDWIAFHCGAASANSIESASFVLALSLPDLASLDLGSHERPEASATVILQVPTLGAGRHYRLVGPGLRQGGEVAVGGLPDRFMRDWAENHSLYPRGVDLLLCAGEVLAALPRSVAIEAL
jgi:alpha-D-ribose 1-methylphosphonate 5-triphosphate synthase subunit PhnH